MKRSLVLPAKLTGLLERYKYPALILLLGVALMLWPAGGRAEAIQSDETAPADEDREAQEDYCRRTEKDLEAVLSQMEGAGRVRVMLTLKTGPSVEYQKDSTRSKRRDGEETSLSSEEKTVMVERGSAYNEPAVVSTAYPVFQGALIVAEGAADPGVRWQLSAAVSALLGLGADQITVVKMK